MQKHIGQLCFKEHRSLLKSDLIISYFPPDCVCHSHSTWSQYPPFFILVMCLRQMLSCWTIPCLSVCQEVWSVWWPICLTTTSCFLGLWLTRCQTDWPLLGFGVLDSSDTSLTQGCDLDICISVSLLFRLSLLSVFLSVHFLPFFFYLELRAESLVVRAW